MSSVSAISSAGSAACAVSSSVPAAFIAPIQPRPVEAKSYYAHLWADAATGRRDHSFPRRVEAGKPLRLTHNRPPAAFGESGAWASVRMHYRTDGGAWTSVAMAPDTYGRAAEICIPATAKGQLQVVFELETASGTKVWDNNGAPGVDYRAEILPTGGATIRFLEDWTHDVTGTLRPGQTVAIAYDVTRLLQFLWGTTYNGMATYGASVFVSFDGKPAEEFRFGGDFQQVEMPKLKVPEGAHTMSVWFRGSARGPAHFMGTPVGGAAWDSAWGHNYNFAIAQAA